MLWNWFPGFAIMFANKAAFGSISHFYKTTIANNNILKTQKFIFA